MLSPEYLSRTAAFPIRWHVRSAKTQISLKIHTDQSSQGILWVGKDTKCLQADSEDSDQPVLICVFAGRICNIAGNATPAHSSFIHYI